MRVEGAHDDAIALNGYAPIVSAAAEHHIVRELVLVAPVWSSGGRVNRDHGTRRFGDVHDAVDDERRRFRPVKYLKLIDVPVAI